MTVNGFDVSQAGDFMVLGGSFDVGGGNLKPVYARQELPSFHVSWFYFYPSLNGCNTFNTAELISQDQMVVLTTNSVLTWLVVNATDGQQLQ